MKRFTTVLWLALWMGACGGASSLPHETFDSHVTFVGAESAASSTRA